MVGVMSLLPMRTDKNLHKMSDLLSSPLPTPCVLSLVPGGAIFGKPTLDVASLWMLLSSGPSSLGHLSLLLSHL